MSGKRPGPPGSHPKDNNETSTPKTGNEKRIRKRCGIDIPAKITPSKRSKIAMKSNKVLNS